jgi:hypothetical protein
MWEEQYDNSDSKSEWLSQFMNESNTTICSEQLISWAEEFIMLEIDNCSESMKSAICNSINYDEIIKKIWEILEDEKEEEQEITDDTILINVFCNKCKKYAPPHTVAEHLDISNPIHICPHIH